MHLSGVQSLTTYTPHDISDIAHLTQTTLDSSEIAKLRYSTIPPDEALTWLIAVTEHDLTASSTYPSISAKSEDGLGDIDRAEYLVVRDLNLAPHDGPISPSHAGRIIASCEFRYHSSSHPAPKQPTQSKSLPAIPPFPSSGNGALHTSFNEQIELTLSRTFRVVPYYEVIELATSSSHLRRGIAKQLVTWIFPYADREKLPVVLAASTSGYPLYRKCGFEDLSDENGQVAVRVDMSLWGGEGWHQHVLMVRWPECWEGARDWRQHATKEHSRKET